MKTTSEIYKETGITRKALRVYMAQELIVPTGRNDHGVFLFADEAVSEIRDIRHYQRLGFTLHEISGVRRMNRLFYAEALRKKREELKERRNSVNEMIQAVEKELQGVSEKEGTK